MCRGGQRSRGPSGPVLDDGAAGALVPVGDPAAPGPHHRRTAGRARSVAANLPPVLGNAVAKYDWPVVTAQVVKVYENRGGRGSAIGGRRGIGMFLRSSRSDARCATVGHSAPMRFIPTKWAGSRALSTMRVANSTVEVIRKLGRADGRTGLGVDRFAEGQLQKAGAHAPFIWCLRAAVGTIYSRGIVTVYWIAA